MALLQGKILTPHDIAELDRATQILTKSTTQMQWAQVDAYLHLIAKYSWLVRDLGNGRWMRGLRVGADTIAKFYNETVHFIMGGDRTISIQVWGDIVRTSLSASTQYPGHHVAGNIGSQIIDTYLATEIVTPAATRAAPVTVDRTLLSYADSDIIQRWIMRPNGLDDAVHTLDLLALLYSDYQQGL